MRSKLNEQFIIQRSSLGVVHGWESCRGKLKMCIQERNLAFVLFFSLSVENEKRKLLYILSCALQSQWRHLTRSSNNMKGTRASEWTLVGLKNKKLVKKLSLSIGLGSLASKPSKFYSERDHSRSISNSNVGPKSPPPPSISGQWEIWEGDESTRDYALLSLHLLVNWFWIPVLQIQETAVICRRRRWSTWWPRALRLPQEQLRSAVLKWTTRPPLAASHWRRLFEHRKKQIRLSLKYSVKFASIKSL